MLERYLFISILLLFPLLLFWKKFRKLFFRRHPQALKGLSEAEFYEQFERMFPADPIKKSERWKELIDKAWAVRDFEIDLYWKRANYFWLFQVPAFAAFFAIGKSPITGQQPDEVIVIICLGIIFSTGWLLINKGSKSWQRHWEEYIDLLEQKYYGPFYLTVSNDRTFSVSKINEIVSSSFIVAWALFGIRFITSNHYFDNMTWKLVQLNPIIGFSIFFTLLALVSMLFGRGRGYFKDRGITMYNRKYHYEVSVEKLKPQSQKQNK